MSRLYLEIPYPHRAKMFVKKIGDDLLIVIVNTYMEYIIVYQGCYLCKYIIIAMSDCF